MCHCISRNDGIFQIGTSLKPKRSGSALVRSFARGDLFDHFDNAAPELGIGNARERARERQTLGSREEIRNVGRRGALAVAIGLCGGAARPSLEQERYRHLEYFGDLLNAAGSDSVGAFLVFLNLL